MGEAPDVYPLIKAGRYLGVKPWELAKVSAFWTHAALAIEAAEQGAAADAAGNKWPQP
jgi:hypothetical protein